jgi:hypothetical protein
MQAHARPVIVGLMFSLVLGGSQVNFPAYAQDSALDAPTGASIVFVGNNGTGCVGPGSVVPRDGIDPLHQRIGFKSLDIMGKQPGKRECDLQFKVVAPKGWRYMPDGMIVRGASSVPANAGSAAFEYVVSGPGTGDPHSGGSALPSGDSLWNRVIGGGPPSACGATSQFTATLRPSIGPLALSVSARVNTLAIDLNAFKWTAC